MNDRRIPHIPRSLDNPHTQFNRVTTKIAHQGDGWAVIIEMSHTDTGAERTEISKARWATERQANQAAVTIAHEFQNRITRSHG